MITPPLTTADNFDPRNDHQEVVMNRTRRIRPVRRLAAILAGLATAVLAAATAAPAAFARPAPPAPPPGPLTHPPTLPPGWNKHPPLPPGHVVGPVYNVPVHTVVAGGMPGWQIALIAIGAALLAATAAVLAYRAWTARRTPLTATAEQSAAGAYARLPSAR